MAIKTKDVQVSAQPVERPKANVVDIQRLAEELYQIEQEIKRIEEDHKLLVAPLEQIKDERRGALLQMMQEARVKHIDVAQGEKFYVRSVKATFDITDEKAALTWAKKEGLLRLDKTAANKVLLRLPKVPKGFEQIDTEFIAIKPSKDL